MRKSGVDRAAADSHAREEINMKDILRVAAVVMIGSLTESVQAADWYAAAGAQARDKGSQALAFLPNELWIHAGDTIRWTFPTNELHTVTFLKPGQVRPPLYGQVWEVFLGCPGSTPDGSSFDGSSCLSSNTLPAGQTYSVSFP